MKRFVLPLVLSLIAAGSWAAISFRSEYHGGKKSDVTVYTADVISDVAGAASGTVDVHGDLLKVVVTPVRRGTGIGTTYQYPSNLWDCSLTDPDGLAVAGVGLSNMLSTSAQTYYPSSISTTPPRYPRIDGQMTLSCTNMGTFGQARVQLVTEN